MKTKRIEDAYVIVRTANTPLAHEMWSSVQPKHCLTLENYQAYVAGVYKRKLARIKSEIERHVDDVACDITIEQVECCEWCGAQWTEGDSEHNGGCCSKDAEVMERCEGVEE